MHFTDQDRYQILEKAINKKQAIIIDWKATVWDIVQEIKSILPNLDISSLHEKQVLGDWIEPLTLNGHEYSFKLESPTLILDVLTEVNQVLKEHGQTFVFFDTQDDNYNFIIIDLSELPSYTEKGFLEV